ncbi:MAG: copper-binding protein [bacterium]|nr:copper-binding protein [bacterium]
MVVLCVFVLGLNVAQAVPQKTTEQIKQVCDKAEQRYQKMFGKPSSSEKIATVIMYNYTFCPGAITIKQGESVQWINVEQRTSHSTWFKQAGKEEAERLFSSEKAEMKFDLPPGDYPYLCGPHWESDGMIGKVTVTPWSSIN